MEKIEFADKDRDSGIGNDCNDWIDEFGVARCVLDLLLRVVHVSVLIVEVLEDLDYDKIMSNIKTLRRFYSLSTHTLELLSESKSRLSTVMKFNDPLESLLVDRTIDEYNEMVKKLKDNEHPPLEVGQFERLLKSARIGCFVDYNRNVLRNPLSAGERLMWAHYADSHKGICVEYAYDPSDNEQYYFDDEFKYDQSIVITGNVEYGNVLHSVSNMTFEIINWNDFSEIVKATFFYKDEAFQSENEFRIVEFNPSVENQADFVTHDMSITKIIFGKNSSEVLKKIVKKTMNGNVELYCINDNLLEEVYYNGQ